MRKQRWVSALLLLCLLLFSGCGAQTEMPETEDEAAAESLQIGLSFDSFVIERWLRDRDMFVSTAQSLGADVNVQVANGVVEEQISQIEYFIQKKMDVIVIIAIDGTALTDVVKKAQDAGIKIVCYDRIIENVNADLYISFDNVMVGTLMGEALKNACPEGGNIFAIYGSPTDNNVDQVIEGLTASLADSNLTIVYSDYCENWLAELAFERVNEGLSITHDIVGVMCGNDDLASQAIRALSENRLAGQVAVVAQDAELAACQRIVEGTQEMTVFKQVELEAEAAAVLSVALGRGESITSDTCSYQVTETINDGTYDIPYYSIQPVAVTAENMDEVIIDQGFHSQEDVYLNVSGHKAN
ncbi:MAG: substrate-binding domain-containing protein [Eubacteriales bacterium]|nr:substrate-binding domain-containing protein [Eubacteriales bacterium]